MNQDQIRIQLRDKRKQLKLSQAQLSQRIGVIPATIYNFEKKRVNAGCQTLIEKIADALGFTIELKEKEEEVVPVPTRSEQLIEKIAEKLEINIE